MIYVTVYILLCLLVPFGRIRNRKNTLLLAAASIVLFVFVGYRWEVGCDWTGYLNIFQITKQQSVGEILSSREPGFLLLNIFAHYLDLDYYYINVVGALLFFIGLFFFAKAQENPLAVVALSFPVLIVNMPMSAVRQAIAIGFIMLATNAYRGRRQFSYVAAVLAGGTFHQSAFVFLGLTPLVRLRLSVWTVALCVILAAPGAYYAFSTLFGFYLDRYGDGARDAAGAPFRAALLGIVGIAFFLFLRRRWREKFPDDYQLFVMASCLMVAVLPLALYSSVIGDRVGYYLVPFQLVAMERLSALYRGDRYARLYGAIPYFGLLIFFVSWMNMSLLFEKCYLPYKSILFQ